MKEVNTFENLSFEMYVLETTAQCVRDKIHLEGCKELIFSLSFYDVAKKVLFGCNMLNCRKMTKKKSKYYS